MSAHAFDQSAADLLRTGFNVSTEECDGVLVLWLRGELDSATATDLRRALTEAFERQPTNLALDLTDLSFVDSTGIGMFIGASRRASEAGCSFVLRSPARAVQKVLHLTGVTGLIEREHGSPEPG